MWSIRVRWVEIRMVRTFIETRVQLDDVFATNSADQEHFVFLLKRVIFRNPSVERNAKFASLKRHCVDQVFDRIEMRVIRSENQRDMRGDKLGPDRFVSRPKCGNLCGSRRLKLRICQNINHATNVVRKSPKDNGNPVAEGKAKAGFGSTPWSYVCSRYDSQWKNKPKKSVAAASVRPTLLVTLAAYMQDGAKWGPGT